MAQRMHDKAIINMSDICISLCRIIFFLVLSTKVDTRYIRMRSRRSLRTEESYHEVISYTHAYTRTRTHTHTHTHTHTSAHTNMNIVHFRSDFGNCGSHVLGKALIMVAKLDTTHKFDTTRYEINRL